jgi:acyl dehydratase
MLVIEGLAGLRENEGRDLGVGDWITVSQEMIERFADLTGDDQWIHVDRERARVGPFGTTVAHGYLTLALLPKLMSTIYRVEGFSAAINYGLNRVRFPAPVPSEQRIRGSVRLDRVEPIEGGAHAEFTVTVAAELAAKPVCVAQYVSRYYQ